MRNEQGNTFCDDCTGTCQGMCDGFIPAGAKASMESLKRHQQQIANQKNRDANNVARAIVKLVETETSKELSLECRMRIVAMVQEAQ